MLIVLSLSIGSFWRYKGTKYFVDLQIYSLRVDTYVNLCKLMDT